MSAVQTALDAILNQWAANNSIDVAWENVTFDPEHNEPYVASFMLPATTRAVGMGDGSTNDYTGIYQINVSTKKGNGTKRPRELVDSLLIAFDRGVSLDGVRIEHSWASGAIPTDARYTVPISVRYRRFN